jgi:hypothetical protein
VTDATLIAPFLNYSSVPTGMTGENAAERVEFLRNRLLERDVTVEEVWDYLILNHQPHQGMVSQNLADFVKKEDLAAFWWLHDWWEPVANKPQTLPTPTILQFCWYVNHTPGAPATTFDDALKQFYQRALSFCKANDLDEANPGETADERKRRRNRERMALVRGHRPVPEKRLKDNETLKAQVRGLEAQALQLKQDAKDADEHLRLQVLQHQTAMLDAAQRRKECAADYKQRIEALREEVHKLTAKQ